MIRSYFITPDFKQVFGNPTLTTGKWEHNWHTQIDMQEHAIWTCKNTYIFIRKSTLHCLLEIVFPPQCLMMQEITGSERKWKKKKKKKKGNMSQIQHSKKFSYYPELEIIKEPSVLWE